MMTLPAAGGFTFRFPTLDRALADLAEDGVAIARCREVPNNNLYLKARGARYVLRAKTELAAPRRDVFAFFSSPENLAALTPPNLAFEIAGDRAIEMRRETLIDYRIRIAGLPLRWRTMIEQWRPGECFVDSQLVGPYRAWWHEHRFYDHGAGTVMEDVVYYSPPLGGLGRLVVEGKLRRIFAYRRDAIRARYDRARS
jgi:ligand-binding SRPBCC domain-containing protein